MRERCNNPNNKDYALYGGRGIYVCDEWDMPNGYPAFKKWAMANGYDDKLTIDRIDDNGNYTPNNCRWATEQQQANNRRTNVIYVLNGQCKTRAELAREYGIDYFKLRNRMKKGWTLEEALEIVPRENVL